MRLLGENRPLQPDQFGTRIQPQLVGQNPTRPVDRPKRLPLPSGPIVGQRQRHPPLFPQRFAHHLLARRARRLLVLAGSQPRRHQLLLRPAHQLGHPRRRRQPRLPTIQIGVRLARDQCQRLAQPQRRPLRFGHPRQALSIGDQPLEAPNIDLVIAQRQPVPTLHRRDRLSTQGMAQPDHTAVHHLAHVVEEVVRSLLK